MLAAAFHPAIALRRCRWVAAAERRERGGTKRLLTAENTLTNRCRYLGDRKPLHHPLSPTERQMRILRSVIQPFVRAVFDCRHDLAPGGCVGAKLVS